MLARLERRSERMHGLRIDYAASYWTPPMTPKLAFELETRQVEKLNLRAMVSITDHDTITAPMLLRTVPSARQIPVSVEWSAPYGNQSFHLGVHNLPSAKATEWMETLAEYTANPSDKRLTEILKALDEEPNVLVVFNLSLIHICGLERGFFAEVDECGFSVAGAQQQKAAATQVACCRMDHGQSKSGSNR